MRARLILVLATASVLAAGEVGAWATAQSPFAGKAGVDTRITAAIALSPNARNKTNLQRQFASITMPFFSITGSEDGSVQGDGTKPEDRRLPFVHMPVGEKFLAVLEGDSQGR